MLFRLANTLATFQVYINWALTSLVDITCVVYLDNILIYSKDKEDYIKYIKIVLKALNKYSLRLELKKYKFYKTKINFLDYIVEVNRV